MVLNISASRINCLLILKKEMGSGVKAFGSLNFYYIINNGVALGLCIHYRARFKGRPPGENIRFIQAAVSDCELTREHALIVVSE